MANFSINGVLIKNPTTFKIERYNVTTMVGDLVAKKRKFYFVYEAITAEDLETILNAIWETNDIFYPLIYLENGWVKRAIVYVGSIPTELHRGGATPNWVWKNVQFNLIER